MKKVIALLAAASGLPKTALASCVNDDGSFNEEEFNKQEAKIQEGIEAKLKTAKDEAAKDALKGDVGRDFFNDAFKKGEAKAHERNEKRLREHFGVEDGSLSGDDLLKAIAASKGQASDKITQDQVERLPWYQALVEKRDKEHKAEIAKMKEEHEGFKKGVARKDTLAEMRRKATPIIEELNLALSKDPARKASQLDAIWERLEANDYDIQEDRVLVLKDGKVMKDKMENSIAFRDHVTGIATALYDPMESKERGSAGVKNEDKGKGGKAKWTREMPKNEEEAQRVLMDQTIPLEERQALREALNTA